jgi:hypothetical protein
MRETRACTPASGQSRVSFAKFAERTGLPTFDASGSACFISGGLNDPVSGTAAPRGSAARGVRLRWRWSDEYVGLRSLVRLGLEPSDPPGPTTFADEPLRAAARAVAPEGEVDLL